MAGPRDTALRHHTALCDCLLPQPRRHSAASPPLLSWLLSIRMSCRPPASHTYATCNMQPATAWSQSPEAPSPQCRRLSSVHYVLQATSLAHSLLLVSTSPVINVGVALLLRHAISAGEVAGSLAALAGDHTAALPYRISVQFYGESITCANI